VPIDNGKISLVQAARECSNVFYWTVLNQCSPLSSSVLRQFNFWYTKGELGKNDSNVHSLNSEFMALRIYFVSGYQQDIAKAIRTIYPTFSPEASHYDWMPARGRAILTPIAQLDPIGGINCIIVASVQRAKTLLLSEPCR
jgi:hypothetical protein